MIRFLRLKNWQVFILACIFPVFISIFLLRAFDLGEDGVSIQYSILMGWYYLIFVLWNFAVITIFNAKVPILSDKQNKVLRLAFIGLILYGFYLIIPPNVKMDDTIMMKISPVFMLIGAFSIIYSVFCTAKTLKTLQHKDDRRTADIVIEIILILYFMISVWWIQRRVNKLIDNLDDL